MWIELRHALCGLGLFLALMFTFIYCQASPTANKVGWHDGANAEPQVWPATNAPSHLGSNDLYVGYGVYAQTTNCIVKNWYTIFTNWAVTESTNIVDGGVTNVVIITNSLPLNKTNYPYYCYWSQLLPTNAGAFIKGYSTNFIGANCIHPTNGHPYGCVQNVRGVGKIVWVPDFGSNYVTNTWMRTWFAAEDNLSAYRWAWFRYGNPTNWWNTSFLDLEGSFSWNNSLIRGYPHPLLYIHERNGVTNYSSTDLDTIYQHAYAPGGWFNEGNIRRYFYGTNQFQSPVALANSPLNVEDLQILDLVLAFNERAQVMGDYGIYDAYRSSLPYGPFGRAGNLNIMLGGRFNHPYLPAVSPGSYSWPAWYGDYSAPGLKGAVITLAKGFVDMDALSNSISTLSTNWEWNSESNKWEIASYFYGGIPMLSSEQRLTKLLNLPVAAISNAGPVTVPGWAVGNLNQREVTVTTNYVWEYGSYWRYTPAKTYTPNFPGLGHLVTQRWDFAGLWTTNLPGSEVKTNLLAITPSHTSITYVGQPEPNWSIQNMTLIVRPGPDLFQENPHCRAYVYVNVDPLAPAAQWGEAEETKAYYTLTPLTQTSNIVTAARLKVWTEKRNWHSEMYEEENPYYDDYANEACDGDPNCLSCYNDPNCCDYCQDFRYICTKTNVTDSITTTILLNQTYSNAISVTISNVVFPNYAVAPGYHEIDYGPDGVRAALNKMTHTLANLQAGHGYCDNFIGSFASNTNVPSQFEIGRNDIGGIVSISPVSDGNYTCCISNKTKAYQTSPPGTLELKQGYDLTCGYGNGVETNYTEFCAFPSGIGLSRLPVVHCGAHERYEITDCSGYPDFIGDPVWTNGGWFGFYPQFECNCQWDVYTPVDQTYYDYYGCSHRIWEIYTPTPDRVELGYTNRTGTGIAQAGTGALLGFPMFNTNYASVKTLYVHTARTGYSGIPISKELKKWGPRDVPGIEFDPGGLDLEFDETNNCSQWRAFGSPKSGTDANVFWDEFTGNHAPLNAEWPDLPTGWALDGAVIIIDWSSGFKYKP